MFSIVGNLQHRIINAIQDHVKRWLRPSIASPMHGVAGDLVRSRADLIAENAFLRQQLIVLQRGGSRPKLKNSDRIKLVLIAKRVRSTIARITPLEETRTNRGLSCQRQFLGLGSHHASVPATERTS